MYTAALQDPARKALCSLVKYDKDTALKLLATIETDIFNKPNYIPAHLLSSNINQETYLILDLLR